MATKASLPVHNHRHRISLTPSAIRLPFLTTLLALLIGVSALSACDNEGIASTPTQIPPPTSAPYYRSEHFFIVARSSESINLNLLAGHVLTVSYVSLRRTTNNLINRHVVPPAGIQFQLIGTLGDMVLQVEPLHENQVEFRVERAGAYQLVFTNPYRIRGLEVPVDYAINP